MSKTLVLALTLLCSAAWLQAQDQNSQNPPDGSRQLQAKLRCRVACRDLTGISRSPQIPERHIRYREIPRNSAITLDTKF